MLTAIVFILFIATDRDKKPIIFEVFVLLLLLAIMIDIIGFALIFDGFCNET